MKIKLKNVQISFPSLFTTSSFNGVDTGKYDASFLIAKDSDQAKMVQEAVKSAGVEEFGAKEWPKAKLCLKDGDDKPDLQGYPGSWVLRASTKKRPLVINGDKTPITAEDDVIYGGCLVNASLDVRGFNSQYGRFITATLLGVQFAGEGERFGGGSIGNALDDFDDEGEATSTSAFDEAPPF